jgi:hypothetical protein
LVSSEHSAEKKWLESVVSYYESLRLKAVAKFHQMVAEEVAKSTHRREAEQLAADWFTDELPRMIPEKPTLAWSVAVMLECPDLFEYVPAFVIVGDITVNSIQGEVSELLRHYLHEIHLPEFREYAAEAGLEVRPPYRYR